MNDGKREAPPTDAWLKGLRPPYWPTRELLLVLEPHFTFHQCFQKRVKKINRFYTRPLVICLAAHTHSPVSSAAGKRNAKSHSPAYHDAPQENEGLVDRTHAAVHCCIWLPI